MIESHLSDASLNDYAEGWLTGTELARAERHLAECIQCRSAANRLCAVLEQLRELPRELDPGVDLLPAIRAEARRRRAAVRWHGARLRREDAGLREQGPGSERRRALRDLRWPRVAAAAAVALIVAGATFTVLTVRPAGDGGAADRTADPATAAADGGRPQTLGADTTDDGALDELQRLEAEYTRATDELLAAFREERGRLGDGTVRLIEDNIRTIDRALRQSQRALSTDPNSPVLRKLVLAAHRQRLDVLRRAAVVAGGS